MLEIAMCKANSFFRKSLLLVLAASLLIACGGKEERKAKYLERGKAYFEEQNYDKAKVEFKNVLQIDPKTAEPYYFLGQIEEKEQNWQKAFGNYKKASELDPDLAAARVKLAQFYLAQAGALRARDDAEGAANALGLAQEQVTEVLARAPQDPEGLTLEANLWVQEGETDKAMAQLEKVLARDPGLSSAVIVLSGLYETAERSEDAERVLIAGVDAADDPTQLRLRLAQFYGRQQQLDKAEQVLRALIDSDPEKLAYRISLASMLSQSEQRDKAEQVLREAIQVAPDEAQRYVLLAEFLAAQRSKDAAIQELNGFIQQHPEMTELRFALVKLRLDNQQIEEAKKTLEEIIVRENVQPAGLTARAKLAQVLASQDPDDARIITLLDEVLKENPRDNDALLLKGKLEVRRGNYVDAIANLRSVLKDQPNSAEVLQLLAAAHLANGERELARDTMLRAVEANPGDNELRLSLVQLLVKDDKPDEAMEQVEEVLKRDQYQETALAMKYELLGRKGDTAGMEQVAKLMQAGAPEKEEGYLREAQLRFAQGDYDAALNIVNRVLEKSPDSVAALIAKSDTLAAKKEFAQAIKAAEKLQQVSPESGEGYYRKGRLLVAQGDDAAALAEYEAALQKAPDSPLVLGSLIELEAKLEGPDKAGQRLKALIEENPEHSSAHGLLGRVYLAQKNYLSAEQEFQRQIEIEPEAAGTYTQLAQTRAVQGNLDGAAEAFNSGLKIMPDNSQLLIGLAGVRERQQDYDAAIALYEQVLQQQPDNAISINNLAALLSDHRTDAASLDKAAELAEKLEKTSQPAFLDTAGWVYYRKGDYDKALSILKRVVEEAPQVPVFRYHLGMTYFQKGDKAAAGDHLAKATDGDYDYQGVEEARATLESL